MSVLSVSVTQLVLFLSNSVLDIGAVLSNILAVCIAAWPAYLLNRYWVWVKRTAHSLTREIVPFWTYNLVGLAASTLLVALADRYWDGAQAVHAANLVAFGALWFGKFVFLDRVLFVTHESVS